MIQLFRKKRPLLFCLRAFLSCAELIGFAAQFIFHVMVSVASQSLDLIIRYTLIIASATTQGVERIITRVMYVIQQRDIITTIQRNNTTWIKIEINGFSILLGRRNKSDSSTNNQSSTATETKETEEANSSTIN